MFLHILECHIFLRFVCRDEDLAEYFEKFISLEKIDLTQPSNVVFARDTRSVYFCITSLFIVDPLSVLLYQKAL